jgi:hypothetical protein
MFLIFNRPILEEYFSKLKGACTSFDLAFMQFEITFLSQLGENTLRCCILDVQKSIFHSFKIFHSSLF